jgi:hypothetical protein
LCLTCFCVACIMVLLTYIECLRMAQKQLKIKEPPGSSLCCIEYQTCHVLVTFRYECPHIFFGFNGVYRLMTVTVLYVKILFSQLTNVSLGSVPSTGCLTGGIVFPSPQGQDISCTAKHPDQVWGPLSLSFNEYRRIFS